MLANILRRATTRPLPTAARLLSSGPDVRAAVLRIAQQQPKGTTADLRADLPTKFEVWPQEVEDYTFNLQTASNVVAPPTMLGEFVKLDKGPAIESLKKKHYLRPFLLDVYRVDFNFG